MNKIEKVIKALEFDKVLDELTKYASIEETKDILKTIKLNFNKEDIIEELKKTDEGYVIINRYERFSFLNIYSPKDDLELANMGGILNNKSLLNIKSILKQSKDLKKWAIKNKLDEAEYKIYQYIDKIESDELESSIEKVILNEDEIKDEASKELYLIRKKLENKSNKIKDNLEKLINGKDKAYLMERLITIRDNRYVIPVKSEYKNEVKGMVHDVSSSGNTIFIEPMAVVDLNNEIKILQKEEKEEIERILKSLSNEVNSKSNKIKINYNALIEIDKYLAKGEYAKTINATFPKINEDNYINLKKARHPLIDKDIVVPIDIEIKEENRALIITGPNTGGKTVALKTLGIFSLMLSAGLMIPCQEDSDMAIFDKVLLNIGDEQSIEQSLSTFSADMKNIIEIINSANSKSLILLDELGSGTDPKEGAALAIAIMDELISKKATIAATTHYDELKIYALEKNEAVNGSFEFDVKTLRPTYKLNIGMPGKSNAFEISKRLGLKESVLENAKSKLSTEKRTFEGLINGIEDRKRKLDYEINKTKQIREEIEKIKEEKENELILKIEKYEIENKKIKEKLEYILDITKEESNKLINKIKELEKKRTKENKNKIIKSSNEFIVNTQKKLKDVNNLIKDNNKGKNFDKLKKDDEVIVKTINQVGKVIETADKNKNVLVAIGKMKLRVNENDLTLKRSNDKKPKSIVSKTLNKGSNKKVRMSIDVRGENLIDAIKIIDDYINESIINRLEMITIVHGIGTGILKKGIRDFLRSHKNIESFRPGKFGEGEDGVTIAILK